MQTNNARIVYDPYSDRNLQAYINAAIKKALQKIQTCIPAIVKEVVSRDTVIATPAVQQTDSEWRSVPWASIKLPVQTPTGGNIALSCPLAVGDTGWIIAGDLDPSLYLQDLSKPAQQNTFERHKYQFGFFVPDKIKGFTVGEEDDGALFIGTSDGSTKITLRDGEISIVSKSELKIKAENVKINADGNVSINDTDWKTHTHGVGTLTTTATVGSATTPGVLSGSTGGVD